MEGVASRVWVLWAEAGKASRATLPEKTTPGEKSLWMRMGEVYHGTVWQTYQMPS